MLQTRIVPSFSLACFRVHVRVRVCDALAASKNLSSSCEGLCPFMNCYLFKIWRQPQVSFCALFLSPSQGQGAQIREKITWLGNPCPAPYFNQPPQILLKRYKIAIKIHLSAQCYSPLSALSLDRFLVSQVPSFLPPAGDNTTLCPRWRWIRPAPSSAGRPRAATWGRNPGPNTHAAENCCVDVQRGLACSQNVWSRDRLIFDPVFPQHVFGQEVH